MQRQHQARNQDRVQREEGEPGCHGLKAMRPGGPEGQARRGPRIEAVIRRLDLRGQTLRARELRSVVPRARLDVERYTAEAQLYNHRLETSRLRSPIAGVVVTPHVEEKAGERVQPGYRFCEVVEQDRMAVEMRVPETDIGLVRAGSPMALKLNSFPTVTFRGTVERVGEQTAAADGEQYFVVRAIFGNRGGLARDGMIGDAKITAAGGYEESGWYPVGYVLFRAPARWVWEKFWSWMP